MGLLLLWWLLDRNKYKFHFEGNIMATSLIYLSIVFLIVPILMIAGLVLVISKILPKIKPEQRLIIAFLIYLILGIVIILLNKSSLDLFTAGIINFLIQVAYWPLIILARSFIYLV